MQQKSIFSWLMLAAAVMAPACAALPRAASARCVKDYAALKEQELAVIDRGEAIEAKLQSNADVAKLSPAQRKQVDQAEALLASRSRIADDKDVAIVDRARALLRDESMWDRADDRQCEGKAKLSLFCALQAASREVVGEYQHRRTALQDVRFALEDATKDREYEHRLRDFNNDPRTKLSDVYAVLAIARARLVEKLALQRECRL